MNMNYKTTPIEIILQEVDKKWDREYQNVIASEMLYDLGMEYSDETDDMALLAECLSTSEWREWLVDNFLTD
jgi:hypothetical protein